MKAITVKQPWASLIVEGYKDIENRTWKTNFRGRVLIHAGEKPFGNLKKDSCISHILTDEQHEAVWSNADSAAVLWLNSYPFGAIIGSVEIVDCVVNHPSVWADKSAEIHDVQGRVVHKFVTYNWVLAHPILFPKPIPVKGKLSFWEYPNILAEPEEKDGPLFCHCDLRIDEEIQVAGDSTFGYYCRYCGGRWYK